ncbi:acetyl-CoA carboxylase biotin carboxylase subunit [Saccharicrinis sp. FJH62]|uniref:acetyl-CoA carboxylase biotin carboxylase subunit n=1 Tax=Saccharicrinis sp. FJH62 TaxID=3344657 RepID=UPI0035D48C2B
MDIKKVLIANRGEIAVRIIRSCREMGIKTVAVYSEADRNSLHVRYADYAYFLGPSPSNESYLSITKILQVAKDSGADAIHPGYGFLSENAEFAKRCRKQGIIFIGPSAQAISTMGDKITARQTMINAGVPVVPGTQKKIVGEKDVNKVVQEIGFPVMVKASAGGGGKGMRLVRKAEDLLSGINAARSEASAAFGDDAVYIEKYIESPHHIEFQVMADSHGNAIHLCERECSVQRRHQKVVEETPSPLMTPELRAQMGEAAVAAAKAVSYEGAGTIEFLVDNSGNYFFLEMNTRLQVEHPITERVVGVDLVKLQILVAQGEKLPYTQNDIKQTGHAIECRIYAEDPDNNFMPSPGLIKHITEPKGLGVRTDGYVYEGYEIPLFYDPMISKLIVWDRTREDAIARMKRALHEYKITGVKTSIGFLKRIMNHEDFKKGNYDTHFIDNNMDELMQTEGGSHERCRDIAAIVSLIDYHRNLATSENKLKDDTTKKWIEFGRKMGVIRL